jgi:hypothetical protein
VKQKCTNVYCDRRRPKKRVPVHARTLRDDPYPTYEAINGLIHGKAHDEPWTYDCCGVCGKPASTARHNDRDHDHLTGNPRGLACPGNRGCNALMPSWMTAERAELIAAYLHRVEEFYSERVEAASRD